MRSFFITYEVHAEEGEQVCSHAEKYISTSQVLLNHIDREFIKDLKTEALDMLIKERTLDELIEKHNIFRLNTLIKSYKMSIIIVRRKEVVICQLQQLN